MDGFDGGADGDDCNDDDATIYPGADEVAYDGIDQDCDAADLTDVDMDGFDGGIDGDDCNDDDALVYPGAADGYDMVDSDCDGMVDEDDIVAGDIILTEAMVNPAGVEGVTYVVLDADGEWFELYNTSEMDINLLGWTFSDDLDDAFRVEEDLIIEAGGYLVFANNADYDTNGGVNVDYAYAYGDMRLANTDDEFVITMGETEIYGINWYAADWPYASGYAMGWDGEGDWALGESWCAQSSMLDGGDYGTPGMGNDACLDFTCALSELEVGEISYLGDTSDSSSDFEHSCTWSDETGPDDAYSFMASEAGCYSFSTTVSGWEPVIAAFTDCGGAEISCADSEYSGYDPETWDYLYTSDLQIGLEAGETTTVVVDGISMSYGDWGPYALDVGLVDPLTAPAAYEHLDGSPVGDAVVSGTTVGLEHGGEHSCTSTYGGTEILSWTAPSDGCYYFDLSESDYDTVMSVFSGGDACGVGEACNDDDGSLTSGVEVDLAEGDMATILISGFGSDEGDYVLDINPCGD
jgi:hypothetical protein